MNAQANTTTVTVTNPDQAGMARSAQSAIALVEAFEVVDTATYELAADELKDIKARAKQLDDQRKSLTKPLDEVKKNIMDLFRQPLELLTKAENIIKGKMLDYQREEQRKAAEERRKAEEAATAERERLRKEAQDLAAEGKHGEAALKTTVAEMVAPTAVHVEAPPQATGISTRKTVDFEVQDLMALVAHIATRPELIGLIKTDDVKLRAYVRGLGMACKLPGVRVFEKETLAARS